MNEKKLKIAWIGTLIGAFVLIVAMVLVWKFKFYDPLISTLATTNTAFETNKTQAAKLDGALKSALLAQQRLDLASGELDYFRTRYRSLPFDLTESPIIGQGPRNATWRRYLTEYASGFGLEARRQLIRAADESGVKISTNIKVQAPPQNPEEVTAPASGLLKPQTETLAVKVTGPFGNILNFFQIINRSEILMTIGNVKVEGTSPTAAGNSPATAGGSPESPSAPVTPQSPTDTSTTIEASFTITPYLLVSGPSATVAPIPGIENARPGAAAAAPATGVAGGVGPNGEPLSTEGAPPTAPGTPPAT